MTIELVVSSLYLTQVWGALPRPSRALFASSRYPGALCAEVADGQLNE